MNDFPVISVVMITYDHEKFIKRAIEGVLMQQCNYNIELLIADDNSPDNTEKTVRPFLSQNHNNNISIQYIRHSSNKGMINNFIWTMKKAIGKYIALCEGDDYWTDPLKLQKQVDFLEGNRDYVLTYHDYRNLYFNNNGVDVKYGPIKKNRPMTLTLLYKNVISNYPVEIFESANPDTFLRALLSDHGKFYYMDNIAPGIRGVHDSGAVSTLDELDLWPRRIKTHEALLKYYKGHKKEAFYREKVARFKIKYNSLLLKNTSLSKKINIYKDSFYEALNGHCMLYFIKRMILQKD